MRRPNAVLVRGRSRHLVIEGNKIFVLRSLAQAEQVLAATTEERATLEHFLVASERHARQIEHRLRRRDLSSVASRDVEDDTRRGPIEDGEAFVRALAGGSIVTRVGGRHVINDPLEIIRPGPESPDPEAPPPVKRPTWVIFHVRDQQESHVSKPLGACESPRLHWVYTLRATMA